MHLIQGLPVHGLDHSSLQATRLVISTGDTSLAIITTAMAMVTEPTSMVTPTAS